MDSCHALELLIELLKTKVGRAKGLDVSHTMCNMPEEVGQSFVIFFLEVEEGVVCIETWSWFVLLMEFLELVPHLFRITLAVMDMVLLELIDAKEDGSCC